MTKKRFILIIAVLLSSIAQSYATKIYWIGGAGNWSDTLRWSNTSGGVSAGRIPNSADTVYFDSNSGLTGANTASLTASVQVRGVYFSPTAGRLQLSTYTLTTNFFVGSNSSGSILGTSGTIRILGTRWELSGTPRPTVAASGVTIRLQNTGNVQFIGGAITYQKVYSSAAQLSVSDANTFTFIEIAPSSTLIFESGKIHNFDTLNTSGTCLSPTYISASEDSAMATFRKRTGGTITASNLYITNVEAQTTGGRNYNLTSSTTINSPGWSHVGGRRYYWVGNSGNWTDGSKWSFTSGGAPAGCYPHANDTVYFNAASFSANGRQITINDEAFFKTMTWTVPATRVPRVNMQHSMHANGNVTLSSGLTLVGDSTGQGILFNAAASFNAGGALLDCNVAVSTQSPTNIVTLTNNLNMTDSSNIYLLNGQLHFGSHTVKAGSILVLEMGGTKALNLGSADITLGSSFKADSVANFTFNAGTSKLYIGSDSLENNLTTSGLTFNEVSLKFSKIGNLAKTVSGNNTFGTLNILGGSVVNIQPGSTQRVNNVFNAFATCSDSIYIKTPPGVHSTFHLPNSVTSSLRSVNISNVAATGTTPTLYYSKNWGGNATGWIFDTIPPATPQFSHSGGLCLGDTIYFQNQSSVLGGNLANMRSEWNFGDGSGYWDYTGGDTTWINYMNDTSKHVFRSAGNFTVVLKVTELVSGCYDTISTSIQVYNPSVYLSSSNISSSICTGEDVTFRVGSNTQGAQFRFFRNNVAVTALSAVDTFYTAQSLVTGDSIHVRAYQNGCESTQKPGVLFIVNPKPVFGWTISDSDQIICAGDTITFTANSTLAHRYRYLIDSLPVTSFNFAGNYSTSSIANGQQVSLVAIDTAHGCTDTISTSIQVNPLPNPALSGSVIGSTICAGDNVTFTASGANTYEFFVNDTSLGSPSATTTWQTNQLQNGQTVSLKGYSVNGCTLAAPQIISYYVNPLPNITFSSSHSGSACSGEPVTFTASGASSYTYLVNGVPAQGPSASNTYSTNALSHNDIVRVRGSFGGCTNESSPVTFSVTQSPATTLTSDAPGNTLCQNQPVTITAGGANTYEFFINGVSQGAASAGNTFQPQSVANGQIISVNGYTNGCSVARSLSLNILPLPAVNLFSDDVDNAICVGEPITFTAVNASLFEFFVNGTSQGAPQMQATYSPNLPVGNSDIYAVGTGANGCKDTSQNRYTVIVNDYPNVTLQSSDTDHIICQGDQITFNSSGADLYQFYINGSSQGSLSTASSFSTSGLSQGYEVHVRGVQNGCNSYSDTIHYTVNPIPALTFSGTDIDNIFCEGSPVIYTASGADLYQFYINGTSHGTPSITNTYNANTLLPGNYALTVQGEANGCFANSQVTATVNALPTATLTSSDADNIICNGDLVTYTATGGYTYEFFVNNVSQGTPGISPSRTFSNLAQNDVVKVRVISSVGCPDETQMLPLSVNPLPTATLTSSDPDLHICANDNITFNASGGTEYEFFVNGISQGLPSATAQFSTTALSNGNQVQVNVTQAGCNATSLPLVFTVQNYPAVFLNNLGNLVLCEDEPVNLVASGADEYRFFINGTPVSGFLAANTFQQTVNSQDVVTVEGSTGGCITPASSAFSYTVHNYPIMSVSSTHAGEACYGEQVVISANGGQSYDFYINGLLLQSGTANSFSTSSLYDADTISVVGKNAHCAANANDLPFTIRQMNLNWALNSPTIVCEGTPITVTASGGDLYRFYLNGIPQNTMGAATSFTFNNLSNNDQISFSAQSSATNCIQDFYAPHIIHVMQTPTITPAGNTTFCEGDSVILYSNYGQGNTWLKDGQLIPGATHDSIIVSSTGQYTLQSGTGTQGSIWSVGYNSAGTFGNGQNINSHVPQQALLGQEIVNISAGADFVLAQTGTGQAFAWGKNNAGQLGNGTFSDANQPRLLNGLPTIKSIAAAGESAAAVSTAGDLYVWGENLLGQLGTGNYSTINFPHHNTTISGVEKVVAGRNHFLLLKQDGTVWAMGQNQYGQLGVDNILLSNQIIPIPTLSGIVEIGTGENTSFAADSAGNLYVWGANNAGQLGLGHFNGKQVPTLSPLKKIKSIDGGSRHTLFVTQNGDLYATGGNEFGQLGLGDTISRNYPEKVHVTGVDKISAGEYTSLIKRADGSVFGFGKNNMGQLGNITVAAVTSPTHLEEYAGAREVEAGRQTSHVVLNTNQTCPSASMAVSVTPSPIPQVAVNGHILSATAVGASGYQWYYNGNSVINANQSVYQALTSGNYHVEASYPGGCSRTSDIFPIGFTGIDPLHLASVEVYPNPCTEFVYVSVGNYNQPAGYILTMHDMAGRELYKQDLVNDEIHTIPMETWAPGTYNIWIRTNDFAKNFVIIKTN